SDQVYSCGREPREEIYEAVRQTQGVVLQYTGRTIAGFFVAGSRNQPPPECRGSTDDPTNTERYVTYNEGLSGDGITQTRLGFVDPTNLYNRGCLSQNGSHCLAGVGYGYEDMLRFYYGADIEIVVAEGSCVEPPDAGVETPDAGFDAALETPDAGPSVEVVAPSGTGGSLSSGCAAGGASGLGCWLLLALALPRRRR
ncbi:MAG: hypothetical protein KC586_18780, partial [Myxococcales bacterium]|nr:hypothetical protein [Myxococcales bacterium]